ncbi:7810_t:CDS:2 [Acaulospora morrowiae]|uniref:Ubiquitin-like-conjugating enzyme ATG10 n=1 Tax=Acaulospora morrowiae TaxID=94023 RepID=A0A9N9CJJ7_9GLOM|nr:7810_t:CDS:2 [Acaulospora morrowiae]
MSVPLPPNTFPKQYPFLTRQEFEIAAKLFIAQSRKASDTEVWNWVEHEKVKGFGYLCRSSIVPKVMDKDAGGLEEDIIPVDDVNEQRVEVVEEEDPSEFPMLLARDEYLTVNYHIIFSTSYKVPVLYFNVCYDDGTPLKIDEIYSHLVQPLRLDDIKTAGFYGGISQQDHPTLSVPFYFLHPCETATLMKSIVEVSTSENLEEEGITLEGYIRSWLSFVGPVVGLKIGIEYFLEI